MAASSMSQRRSLLFAEDSSGQESREEAERIQKIEEMLGEDDIKIMYPESYVQTLKSEIAGSVNIAKEFKKVVEQDTKYLKNLENMTIDENILLPEHIDKLWDIQNTVDKYLETRDAVAKQIEIMKVFLKPTEEEERFKEKMQLVDRVIKTVVFKH